MAKIVPVVQLAAHAKSMVAQSYGRTVVRSDGRTVGRSDGRTVGRSDGPMVLRSYGRCSTFGCDDYSLSMITEKIKPK